MIKDLEKRLAEEDINMCFLIISQYPSNIHANPNNQLVNSVNWTLKSYKYSGSTLFYSPVPHVHTMHLL